MGKAWRTAFFNLNCKALERPVISTRPSNNDQRTQGRWYLYVFQRSNVQTFKLQKNWWVFSKRKITGKPCTMKLKELPFSSEPFSRAERLEVHPFAFKTLSCPTDQWTAS